MTEQQAQSPIDDLFRNAFENLPDTPAESGWDTPSDKVWQHVQTNIQSPQKSWNLKSVLIAAAGFAVTLMAIVLFWTSGQKEPQALPDSGVQPSIEQPAINPALPAENADSQPVSTQPTGSTKVKASPEKPAPRNSTEEKQTKPSGTNGAQPLPGSKTTLPPNSTEAQKRTDKQ